MSDVASLAGTPDAVAIGASAGGVEALSVLLPALPAGLAMPVFVVLHLPRERPSLLVDIFQPKCALPVREAEDKEPVEPGVVYIAPPDYHLLVDAGPRIALSADEPVHFSRPSIDVLFESAADIYADRLLAIVLTGANEDGAAGAAAVERAGGKVLVQDPDSAQASLMPASTIKRVGTAVVRDLAGLAALLASLGLPSHGTRRGAHARRAQR
ncbi:MAG TPA: chemotaxis protein CheB [Caldimonas sp.]|nr:chemotaxis protein CheB [Caldimonas sp.]